MTGVERIILPVEEHTRMLRDFAAAARASDRPLRDHSRVVVVGAFCEQPPLEAAARDTVAEGALTQATDGSPAARVQPRHCTRGVRLGDVEAFSLSNIQ